MRAEQRVRQVCRAGVLPLVLVLTIAWAALSSAGHDETSTADSLPRLTVAAVVPSAGTPMPVDLRPAGKPLAPALLLFAAAVVALLFGLRRRVRWPVATTSMSAAKPSLLRHTVGGRAPPRFSA
ncbi:hypothetical protein Aab01nite_81300 [Paractinoplanes abujensis]|uniref:Uncharacterized protein n=1 Tax=Paractinoplanes abujensis TaxID=882441 RepID=A0A7W7G230_9ACTN|nr:hypothetical protein [Actinoplanes abujensis]MBB4693337.1 hypothetical protein [Actinoplanes abujensis]GID24540.1 hypothetical protein Aab01nite_81300 [Actinoplanes abujensis]